MSRTDWPKLCTIAEAARLFTDAGYPIDRSNLSRWIADRKFEGKEQGKRFVYDPNALFDAWFDDYGRKLMAGRTAAAPAPPPQHAAAPATPAPTAREAPADDPNRDLKRIQAQTALLDLQRQLNRTLSAEEVAAGMASALGSLRAAIAQKAREESKRLLAELGLPATKLATLTAGLKRYASHMQEAWAEESAKLLKQSSTPGTPARERLDALVALDLKLRGLDETGDTPAAETSDPEPIPERGDGP